MLKVFLSSTYKDLIPEREIVRAALQRMSAHYISMEFFGSFAEQPLEKCLSSVRSAEVMILILGYSYGFVPEGTAVSMTEAEYRESKANNIPVLAYLADHKYYSPLSCDDIRLWKLKEELKFTRGVSFYKSPEDLAWKVVSDLAREFANYISSDAPPLDRLHNQIILSPVEDRIDELIAILEDRAQRIVQELAPRLDTTSDREMLTRFQSLHEQHMNSLRERKIIQAHEILIQIHHLLGREPHVCYFPTFSQLNLVLDKYLAGGMREGCAYHPSDSWWMIGQSRLNPLISLRLYKNILAKVSNSET